MDTITNFKTFLLYLGCLVTCLGSENNGYFYKNGQQTNSLKAVPGHECTGHEIHLENTFQNEGQSFEVIKKPENSINPSQFYSMKHHSQNEYHLTNSDLQGRYPEDGTYRYPNPSIQSEQNQYQSPIEQSIQYGYHYNSPMQNLGLQDFGYKYEKPQKKFEERPPFKGEPYLPRPFQMMTSSKSFGYHYKSPNQYSYGNNGYLYTGPLSPTESTFGSNQYHPLSTENTKK